MIVGLYHTLPGLRPYPVGGIGSWGLACHVCMLILCLASMQIFVARPLFLMLPNLTGLLRLQHNETAYSVLVRHSQHLLAWCSVKKHALK